MILQKYRSKIREIKCIGWLAAFVVRSETKASVFYFYYYHNNKLYLNDSDAISTCSYLYTLVLKIKYSYLPKLLKLDAFYEPQQNTVRITKELPAHKNKVHVVL